MGILAEVLRVPSTPRYGATKPYQTITEYAPVFSTGAGELYEQQLTRSCIERIATGCSKLKPEVSGSAEPKIKRAIKTSPNDFMSWSVLLARVATLLMTDTTAFVVPAVDDNGDTVGIFPFKPAAAELIDRSGVAYLRFTTYTGDVVEIERTRVCVLTRFQYASDVFGGGNKPLQPTMRLLDHQTEAQDQAIKNGAKIQFIGKLVGQLRGEDIAKKRNEFVGNNFNERNVAGLLTYDATWDDVKQVQPQSYTVGTDEMERINKSVYTYFGINEAILTNNFSEEQWGAFYESVIEPIAIQLGDGLTQMLYSTRERMRGNRIMFSANRLEYASNASKRNMIRDMGDRGLMKVDEMRAVLQLPPLPDGAGQVYIMRGEYYLLDADYQLLLKSGGDETTKSKLAAPFFDDRDPKDIAGDDDEYNDTEAWGGEDFDQGV